MTMPAPDDDQFLTAVRSVPLNTQPITEAERALPTNEVIPHVTRAELSMFIEWLRAFPYMRENLQRVAFAVAMHLRATLNNSPSERALAPNHSER